MGKPAAGFRFEARNKSGTVVIFDDQGRKAKTLGGNEAVDFLDDMKRLADAYDSQGQQQAMAKITGNYKRGNEHATRPGRGDGAAGRLSL